jgi:TRAP-type C4-dicarboxylate transport system substrate-binding protein
MRMRVIRSAATFVAALVAAAGCGGSHTDKAGGTHNEPLVLTLASGTETNELDPWMRSVAERSGGTLRIRLAAGWRHEQRDFETALIHDVQAGRVDLGWAGSRAFDAVGVASFDALQAPLVIDSYALERAVIRSGMPRRMLADLKRVGLIGLGILPGPLRRVLAAPHPLRTPGDFAGLRIGYQGARGPAQALRALGASPVQLRVGDPWRGIDAVEQQVASLSGNSYDTSGKYLTANLALWPRPLVLFINRRAFARLNSRQRGALTGAAAATVDPTLDTIRDAERAAMTQMCQRGITLVTASSSDLDRLRAATAPILRHLERDGMTRMIISAIRSLRERTAPDGEPPLRCPAPSPATPYDLPEGDYTTTITSSDVARELARIPRGERGALGLSVDEIRDILRARYTLTLRHGMFTLRIRTPAGQTVGGLEGTYSIFRDHFVAKVSDGHDTLRARWSFDGTRLRLSDFSFPGAYRLVWASEPWVLSR